MRIQTERFCECCGRVMVTRRADKRYCSRACKDLMYNRRKREEYAEKRCARPAVGVEWKTVPKSYAEIKLANMRRKVESGWRGQRVLGGGLPQLPFVPLRTSELPRFSF